MAAVPDNSTGGMVAAMYVFCAFYSAAEGPIPFVSGLEFNMLIRERLFLSACWTN